MSRTPLLLLSATLLVGAVAGCISLPGLPATPGLPSAAPAAPAPVDINSLAKGQAAAENQGAAAATAPAQYLEIIPLRRDSSWTYLNKVSRKLAGEPAMVTEGKAIFQVDSATKSSSGIDGVLAVRITNERWSEPLKYELDITFDSKAKSYKIAAPADSPDTLFMGTEEMPLPFAEGKKWDFTAELVDREAGTARNLQINAEIQGKESVDTPAGKFEAFKVVYTGPSSSPVSVKITKWFAPDTGMVKSIVELVTESIKITDTLELNGKDVKS